MDGWTVGRMDRWTVLRPVGVAHQQQQTLVLPDGSAAAQEAQHEEQAAQCQDHVDAREQQRVGGHHLPKAQRVQQHPDPHGQQEGATQLEGEQTFREPPEDAAVSVNRILAFRNKREEPGGKLTKMKKLKKNMRYFTQLRQSPSMAALLETQGWHICSNSCYYLHIHSESSHQRLSAAPVWPKAACVINA